jgi:hypothetical protein
LAFIIPRALVKQSHAIDPDFCRVHYQFAYVYLRQRQYKKMEPHLTRALVCPNTGAVAMDLWNQYWPAIAQQDPTALQRRDKYIQKLGMTKPGPASSSPISANHHEEL